MSNDQADNTTAKSINSSNFEETIGENSSLPEYVHPKIAQKEQKFVFWAELLVVVILLLGAVVTATATYLVIQNEEKNDFQTQFESYASQIILVVQDNARNTFDAIQTYSTTISSYTSDVNMTWPFVTIPDFEARTQRLAKIAQAGVIVLGVVVEQDQRQEWMDYSQANLRSWLQNSIDYQHWNTSVDDLLNTTIPYIYKANLTTFEQNEEDRQGPWLVTWQSIPIGKNPWVHTLTNYNLLNSPRVANNFFTTAATHTPTIGFIVILEKAESQIIHPIFETVDNGRGERKLVGVVGVTIDWVFYFRNILPENSDGIIVTLKSSCDDDVVTYQINGHDAVLLGQGDHHDPKYNHLRISAPFVSVDVDEDKIPGGRCVPELTLDLYPSQELEDIFSTNNAAIYTVIVLVIFLFTSIILFLYDSSVRRLQKKVMTRFRRQDKIVSDIFPANIREKLYRDDSDGKDSDANGVKDGVDSADSSPMADLFPSVTILFADIVGFTAWCSAREPLQIFELLESIFQRFDVIAVKYGVFKVETVGDCYVCVAGLPEPRKDHSVVVARFARHILHEMRALTKKLEVTLGPDTADLSLRMGIHSGQVTAGVLRGKRSRFQLFGDTVNTAARMESTSKRGHIQVSKETSEELSKHGRSMWLKARDTAIFVNGKGDVQTFWLETIDQAMESDACAVLESSGLNMDLLDVTDVQMTKTERLVEWNVEVLSRLLQQILAARESTIDELERSLVDMEDHIGQGSTVLEEFIPIIILPKIGAGDLQKRKDPKSITLSDAVKSQLRSYLSGIASCYRDNAFHSFEHASHVTASVRKLLTRIVKVDDANGLIRDKNQDLELVDVAGHSYGITSDPLTQFAVVFSAVIHDVDHPGVPNARLVQEKTPNATMYKGKSVAEQNSVDLSWELLMRPEYADLRKCIYSNEDELKRFRQLVVNVVMATDICDKELQALRKARWETAFSEIHIDLNPEQEIDRKATIVIEHLIQASDVSHTMQHWDIYKQWNERFFMECYGAYKAGRADADPSTNWYKGEIGFFDFYVIPLAKKLESCGVFGVSSHEYLNYAKANRDAWVREGNQIVEDFLRKYHAKGK